ncbi:response regulator [Desulfobaculum senezii]
MATKKHRILFVDDDTNLLAAYSRQLRKRYDVETANSGVLALRTIAEKGSFSVVVSDFRMPGMDGLQFLAEVKDMLPDASRILLTGYAELDVAIKAVNEGNIFRLLTKPCPPEILVRALADGARHYELIISERELLEETLKGSVAMLSDVMSVIRPDVFGQVSRMTPYVRKLAIMVEDPNPWRTETAAMLSLLGYITLPEKLVRRVNLGRQLNPGEYAMFSEHTDICARIVTRIPRMEEVGRIIAYQDKLFDGKGLPQDSVAGELIPLGSRIIKIVLDFDRLQQAGQDKQEAYSSLTKRGGWYDPKILEAFKKLLGDEGRFCVRQVAIDNLQENMVLAEDVTLERNGKFIRVLARGQEMTRVSIAYLKKYHQNFGISNVVKVLIPWEDEGGEGGESMEDVQAPPEDGK